MNVLPPGWGPPSANPGLNPNNLLPPAACNSKADGQNILGLQFYRGVPISAHYTHTVPPNNMGRDCLNLPNADQFHLAARSYHAGGVNVLFLDGSVHFVKETIDKDTWRALGTRAGNEPVLVPGY